jgi:hypothetical protein
MLESLDTLLQLSLIHKFHDKATVKKMTLKMLKRVAPHVRGEILNGVLASTNPKELVDWHANRFITLNAAANEINEMGFPGMIIHEGIAYPLRLIIEDVHDKEYILKNETRVASQAAVRLGEEIDPGKSTCDVVFFKNRGFSGIRYNFTIGK